MKRIFFHICLFASLASLHSSFAALSPNIVFIMADDLGYNDLSCQGATKVTTVLHACRRIEALIEEDTLFRQEVDFLSQMLQRRPEI